VLDLLQESSRCQVEAGTWSISFVYQHLRHKEVRNRIEDIEEQVTANNCVNLTGNKPGTFSVSGGCASGLRISLYVVLP
jgi:hypothetical protein